MTSASITDLAHDRDPLTGLPGPKGVRRRLAEWADAAGGSTTVHAVLIGFKRIQTINLAYGPTAGDALLVEAGRRITAFAGAELDGPWLAARVGGSRFLIIAEAPSSRERWQLFASELSERLARPAAAEERALRLRPRAALARALAGEGAESLLDRLGHALATAERGAGRRLVWADGEAVAAGHSAAALEADVLAAVDGDQIAVIYQPQFAARGDCLTGAEALARWDHPRLGRIGAGALFAAADRADQTATLSRHVARLALACARDWPEPLRLSLNITPADLADEGYPEELLRDIAEAGADPRRITVEVTEQLLLPDVAKAASALRRLDDAGLRVALDDFGAGFCNFRYLKLLPLHYLKLDRSMVEGIADNPRDRAVLRGIVAMASALGLEVIAEGIETDAQRRAIAAEGCTTYQGFLRAKPMGAEAFAALAL